MKNKREAIHALVDKVLDIQENDAGMSYYKTCPNCGAHLDPGEPCDCGGDEHAEEHKEREEKDYDSNREH